jgi:DNA-binding NtrC family response regulator
MRARFSDRTTPESPPNSQRVLFVHQGCQDVPCCVDALKQLGCHVRTCNSYEDGLRCLEREDFDFVVVCQGSPEFEGRCVLKRAIEINPRMPVLVVARCLDMKCYLDAMGLGAFDYLETPLSASEAVRAMGAYLRSSEPATGAGRNAGCWFG